MQAGSAILTLTSCMAMLLLGACDDLSRNPALIEHSSLSQYDSTTTVVTKEARHANSVRVSQFQMGMMIHLTVFAPSVEQGRQAAAAAFDRVRQVNRIMSDYEPASELSLLSRRAGQGPVAVSPELFEVLATARRLADLTDGRYDPTIGPVVRLWRVARQTGHPPDASALEAAGRLVGYQKLLLDNENQTAELTRSGMQLDLGSIAKGYAGDEALQVLQELSIGCAAFEAGGDKVLGDAPPGEIGWLIELPHSDADPLRLANCAVSVSGDTAQFFELDGRQTSHVIDPRQGQGLSSRTMCMVVAPRGLLADPLATIGTLMSEVAYEAFLNRYFPEVHSSVLPAPNHSLLDKPRIASPQTECSSAEKNRVDGWSTDVHTFR